MYRTIEIALFHWSEYARIIVIEHLSSSRSMDFCHTSLCAWRINTISRGFPILLVATRPSMYFRRVRLSATRKAASEHKDYI